MQMAKHARIERGQKFFQILRQEENEVYIASLARWDTQLKGLVEPEKALSGSDARGEAAKRKTRSLGWPHGRQDLNTE